MTGPWGNSQFCFPETLGEVELNQNSLFPAGPVIKCFFFVPSNSKIEKQIRRNRLLDAGWLTILPSFKEHELITCESKV